MSRLPIPRRLPPIPHIHASPWQQQVASDAIMLITAAHRQPTIRHMRQIHNRLLVVREHRDDSAEQAETGDSTVWVHIQPDVRIRLLRGLLEPPHVPLTRPARLRIHHRLPERVHIRAAAGEEHGLDGNGRRVVAREERGVDLHPVDYPRRNTELDDYPVGRGRVVAPRLPAVVPPPGSDEVASALDGCGGVDEVRRRGEEFVREGDDLTAEGGADEIYKRRLVLE